MATYRTMVRLLLALASLLAAPSALAAPITLSFAGVVGAGSDLDVLLPSVQPEDPITLSFTYDDEAADTLVAFPDSGSYPASGSPFGATVQIAGYEFLAEEVVASISNDSSLGDVFSLRAEVEIDGLPVAATVRFIDPSGMLLDSDSLIPPVQLSEFPGTPELLVTGAGGMFVWLYHQGPVAQVPEPELAWLLVMALSGCAPVCGRLTRPCS